MDAHAQVEIRTYANEIGNEIVKRWCPVAWEAFEDYRLGGGFLTRLDKEVIKLVAQGKFQEAIGFAEAAGWINKGTGELKRNRERDELEAKLRELELTIPWATEGKQ